MQQQRQQYIKPSVLRLDYSTDAAVVSFGSCKSDRNSDTRGDPQNPQGTSCDTSVCSSFSAS
jgi:hypothetical protein